MSAGGGGTRGAGGGRSRRRLVCGVALLVSLLVPAVAVQAEPSAASAGPGCHRSWPVVAFRTGARPATVPAGELPVACATATGYATSESTIALSGDETLVYSPAETENSMARSTNDGATWQLTYPAGEQYTAFWNTVDPDVVSDWRTGWVFWSHATGPLRNEGALPDGSGFLLAAAAGFQVYTSRDNARSWTTADYSTAPTGDWEKVFVGPPPPAAAGQPQPVGYPDVVYLCANSPLEVVGPGRLCYKSLDGGATFEPAGYASPSIGEPADVCPPLDFNAGVVGNHGTIYMPATCEHGAYLVESRTEGSTWTWVPVPHAPPGPLVGGNLLQVALDRADNLYALWPQAGRLYLEVSRDHGRSWGPPMVISAPGVADAQLPAVSAGAAGRVAVTYYGSPDPSAFMLDAYITQTSDALDPSPLFFSGMINDPAQPIFHDYGLSDSPRADFIGGAYGPSGRQFWAGVVKQLGPPGSNHQIATTGYVGRLTGAG